MHRRIASIVVVSTSAFALLGCPTDETEATDTASDTTLTPPPDGGDAGPTSDDVDAHATIVPDVGCTTDDQCAGLATGPLDACERVGCDNGTCAILPAVEGKACDDGDLCTSVDACVGGVCSGTQDLDCDDDNPCTNDSCDSVIACIHTFHQKPCDDETACTSGDTCFMGECLGEEVNCDDNNDCTKDICDPVDACVTELLEGGCDDGDACTAGDTCVAGQCTPSGATVCDDDSPCTTEFCDVVDGCVYTVLDGPCNDGNACTENEICMDGLCVGDLVTCDDQEACTEDYCDTTDGCQFLPSVAPCEDGDPCTLNDMCAEGSCVAGDTDPLCCDDASQCDDADLCTSDACEAGYCTFVALDCDDQTVCTADSCIEGACYNDPVGAGSGAPDLVDGFEGMALSEWTVENLLNNEVTWQVDGSKFHDGAQAAYCGKIPEYTYEVDGLATEAVMRRQISVPAGPKVRFSMWVWIEVGEASCTYDVLRVSLDGVVLDPPVCETAAEWVEVVYDVTAWAGQTPLLAVTFDTEDDFNNSSAGVWVDDITLAVETPEGCCSTDSDCASGPNCDDEICDGAFMCAVPPAAVACDDMNPCTTDACGDDGVCASTPIASCCALGTDCPGDPLMACAVPTCIGEVCGLDTTACCETAMQCPAGAHACEAPTCSDGDCGLDDSLCCPTDVGDCPTPDNACESYACNAGVCELDTSLCCADAGACPTPDSACASYGCVEGSCVLDETLCCAGGDPGECPTPGNACESFGCTEGACVLDASLCCPTDVSECPAPDNACGSYSCTEGACVLDESLCCPTDVSECPAPDNACASYGCSEGACVLDESLCCPHDAGECPTPDDACASYGCSEGVCVLDNSLCCSDAQDCPEPPQLCEVYLCPAGTCELDDSGCTK